MQHDSVILVETAIDRPPRDVWKVLRRLDRWKQPDRPPVHVDGPVGAAGEVLRVGSEGDALFLRTLVLEAPVRWVLKLWRESPPSAQGYIEFALDELDGRTRFTYRVFAASEASGDVAETDAALARRFAAEGDLLKSLVESGDPSR